MEVLNTRNNGNATITLYDNGTRVIDWDENEELDLEYPLSIDLNISNRCDNGCAFCYQDCTKWGKQADLINVEYLEELPIGTEIAINIQRPLNLDLEAFLVRMKFSGLVVNCTINQNHLEDLEIKQKLIQWQKDDLIYGVGVSATDINYLYNACQGLDNINIHLINGIHSVDDVIEVSQMFNVLILGYKMVGRGPEAKNRFQDIEEVMVKNNKRVKDLIEHVKNPIAFDNLALEQINIKDILPSDQWEESYQGDDGTASFYINAVDRTYSINSLTPQNKMKPIGIKKLKDIFREIKEEANGKIL